MWPGSLPVAPEAASTFARDVDALFLFELGVTAFFVGAIAAAVVGLAVFYRSGRDVNRDRPPATSIPLEIAWFTVPFALVLVMFGWGAKVYRSMAEPPDGDPLVLHVVGKQWMWKVQHPDGRREIDTVHVPVGRPVVARLASQDVIHSFYVPAFRIKQDVVPGVPTTVWFEVTRPGTYHLFCAEFCGTAHSTMRGAVVAMEPDAYAAWAAGQPESPGMVASGEELFVQHGCSGCHVTSPIGPDLTGVYGSTVALADGTQIVADEAYLRDAILRPNKHVVAGFAPVMPTFQGRISEEDLLLLLTYLQSLGEGAPRGIGGGR